MVSKPNKAWSAGAPKYIQIKEEILRKILSKEWPDGSQIPVEAEFCEMYGASRITVRKALEELQAAGYLEKQQGRGTFVRCKPVEQRLYKFYSFSEELRKKGHLEQAIVKEFSRIQADEALAEKLSIQPGEMVYRVLRLRRIETGPYAIEKSYIPAFLVPELSPEQISREGLYGTLAMLGIHVDAARETFKAINLNKEQSEWLNVRIDASAIRLTRTAYSGTLAAEYCISIVRGDFFSYSVELN